MSDNESDYYSDSVDSDEESVNDEESVKVPAKKHIPPVNAAKKFGKYIEDESDVDIDDSEPDDDVDEDDDDVDDEPIDDINEQTGGVDDNPVTYDDADDNVEDEDIDNDISDDEQVANVKKTTQIDKNNKVLPLIISNEDNYDDDDDDEYDENYLQKFDNQINQNYISQFHPECLNHNNDEVSKLSRVVRDDSNIIIDPLHRTQPFLTKYEKARILGQRAKQIETGSKPFVKVPENIIDSYVIAELELREKKIPFIIKRPIPGGKFEYWNLKDLEIINF